MRNCNCLIILLIFLLSFGNKVKFLSPNLFFLTCNFQDLYLKGMLCLCCFYVTSLHRVMQHFIKSLMMSMASFKLMKFTWITVRVVHPPPSILLSCPPLSESKGQNIIMTLKKNMQNMELAWLCVSCCILYIPHVFGCLNGGFTPWFEITCMSLRLVANQS